jgi:hypothetical protein
MFQGYVELEGTLRLTALHENSSGVPTDSDSLPGYRVYGPDGRLAGQTGTMSFLDSGSVTGATNASPIVVTSAGHGLTTGTRVTLSGVGGNTAANGTFEATRIDADTFSLDGSAGNGAYTSGGSWHVSGLYTAALTVSAANGYDAGSLYVVLVSGSVSSSATGTLISFVVG